MRAAQPLTTVEALLSGQCDELMETAARALADGTELPVGARLRAAGHPADLVASVFTQAELRRRAAAKFSRAESMLFTRGGLEQATGEPAARHRARRFDGLGRVADLCTGIGGDLIALAADGDDGDGGRGGREVLAVDLDQTHLRFAVHNARVYGTPVSGVAPLLADVRDVDLSGVAGAFVDPARRGGTGRGSTRALAAGAGEPPLSWCFELVERLGPVVVKAAPGLDLGVVPAGWEIEFVADGRDLKEAVLVSPVLAGAASRRATVLSGGGLSPVSLAGEPDVAGWGTEGSLRGAGGGPAREVRAPGEYLYDPSPAVTRAGLVGLLGRQLDAWQIDPRIAFLSSDEARPTPFARLLRIGDSVPFDVRRLGALLRTYGLSSLDVRRRGLAGDVDVIRRRLLPPRRDLVPGGPAVTLVMTRLADRPWALVCTERLE